MWTWTISVAGGVTVLAGAVQAVRIWGGRALYASRRLSRFLDDWAGDEERGVKSFPERMTDQEKAQGELHSQLERLQSSTDRAHGATDDNARAIAELRTEQRATNARLTDHRRRNDEQISRLREWIEHKVDELRDRTDRPKENP